MTMFDIVLIAANIAMSLSLGSKLGMLAGAKNAKFVADHLNDDVVDAKEFVGALHPEVVVITSREDIEPYEPRRFHKRVLEKALEDTDRNLFYVKKTKKRPAAIITSAKVNANLLGHEIGHHRDSIQSTGRIFDSKMRREKAAWDLSPHSNTQTCAMRENALLSYDKAKAGIVFGAVLSAFIFSLITTDPE
jgi:hypothetical protein